MAQAGVTDIADYEEFLMFEESMQLKTEQNNGNEMGKNRKMSLRTFRSNVGTDFTIDFTSYSSRNA